MNGDQVSKVRLAPDLALAADELATLVVALLGNRGSGKSNAAFVILEQLIGAKIPIVVIDYVGIYFSLRLDASGRHPSPYQIPVLGGSHGDITLAPTTGAVVADALARGHASAVLDVSHMSKGDRMRFTTDFAETFFRVKKNYPGPVQLWLEESQRYIPQKIFTGQERMLGAFEEIAEVGRNYGIGLGLISQRPQKLNKDVLNLADLLITLRMNGVHERKAIAEWVQEKDADGRDAVKDELPGLQRGQAIVWSPSVFNLYGTYKLNKRETYDVNATPLKARAAVKVKALDLQELESAMGAVVEEAKANDPRALKARITALEGELWKAQNTRAEKAKVVAPFVPPRVIEKSVIKESDLDRLDRLAAKLNDSENETLRKLEEIVTRLKSPRAELTLAINGIVHEVAQTRAAEPLRSRPGLVHATAPRGERQARVIEPQQDGKLSRCASAILKVLAARGKATDSQLATLSGYRITSSTFANGMSELRMRGLLEGPTGLRAVTAAGQELAGDVEQPPTGAALLDYWSTRLTKCGASMLKVIFDAGTISRGALSAETGYRITSSTFANGMSELRTLDLVSGPPAGDLTIAAVFKE